MYGLCSQTKDVFLNLGCVYDQKASTMAPTTASGTAFVPYDLFIILSSLPRVAHICTSDDYQAVTPGTLSRLRKTGSRLESTVQIDLISHFAQR
jgi:hypothetical protein